MHFTLRAFCSVAVLAALAIFSATPAPAQVPTQLGDFSPGPGSAVLSSDADNFEVIDGRIFFTARGRAVGNTPDGFFVYSMLPDGTDLRTHGRIGYGTVDEVLFSPVPRRMGSTYIVGVGTDGYRAVSQLRGFDAGSATGTTLVDYPLADTVISVSIVENAGKTFFVGMGYQRGFVHVSDAAHPVPQLIHATQSSNVTSAFQGGVAAPLGSGIVFIGNNGIDGLQPWFSDGTVGGTRKIRSINPDPASYAFGPLTALDQQVLFWGPDSESDSALWSTDGTPEGTMIIATSGSLAARGYISSYRLGTRVGDRVVVASPGALLSSDGTTAGTFVIDRLSTGDVITSINSSGVLLGNRLLFAATVADGRYLLFGTDGTQVGTVGLIETGPDLYLDTRPGRVADESTVLAQFAQGNNSDLVLSALITTNGTAAGTSMQSIAAESRPVVRSAAQPIEASILFTASPSGAPANFEPWSSDGTSANTEQLVQVLPSPPAGGTAIIGEFGNRIALTSNGHLMLTDGTASTELTGISVQVGDRCWAQLGSSAIFAGANGPWITDGTVQGTRGIITDGSFTPSTPSRLTPLGGFVYFTLGDNDQPGPGLYRTDGTAEGTRVIFAGTGIGDVIAFANQIWFTLGSGVWKTDGTPAGSRRVTTIPGGGVKGIIGATSDRLVIHRRGVSVAQNEIFAITAAGVRSEIPSTSLAAAAIASGNALYAIASRLPPAEFTQNLVRSDDSGGAQIVFSQPLSALVSDGILRRQIAVLGSKVIFVGNDSQTGKEPWVFDTLTQQASLLRDIFPGGRSSGVERMQTIGDRVYFVAVSPDEARQLWYTDGTPEGTRRFASIAPAGFSSVAPELLSAAGNDRLALVAGLGAGRILFGADDGLTGEEPWLASTCPADFNSDGTANSDDLGDFITAYFNDPPSPSADFNSDGAINADDLGDYVTAYFNGC